MPARTPLGTTMPFEANPQRAGVVDPDVVGRRSEALPRLAVRRRSRLPRDPDVARDARSTVRSRSSIASSPARAAAVPAPMPATRNPIRCSIRRRCPTALTPEDTATWLPVADRGPHASGILTMPVFLTKYGSRRARAHVALQRVPVQGLRRRLGQARAVGRSGSDEAAGLLVVSSDARADGRVLHARAGIGLDVVAGEHLPDDAGRRARRSPRACASRSTIRRSTSCAARTPRRRTPRPGRPGSRSDLVTAPEFAPCVVENVAQSLLGRSLAPEDDAWKLQLVKTFVDGGYRMKALVRAIVKSPRYRAGNDQAMKCVSCSIVIAACGGAGAITPSEPTALPAHKTRCSTRTPKERRRMVSPEVYLRAYLGWFGGLVPLDVQNRARPKGLFDAWDDYLVRARPARLQDRPAAPDPEQHADARDARPARRGAVRARRRARSARRQDAARSARRVRVRCRAATPTTRSASGFDVLHRTFLGYPAKLAPGERVAKFHALFTEVAARHAGAKNPLTADETAWVAVCTALVQHPEAELY